MVIGFSSTGSKRPEALYGLSAAEAGKAGLPLRMERARGCRVWDDAGREYLDFIMGLGSVALGYGHPDVNHAACAAIDRGVVGPLAPVAEERLARRLAGLIPWMEQVRFLKTGAEAVAAAVRIARVHTGRDEVLGCGYHGWLDWCQTATLGVPTATRGLFAELPFNDVERARQEIRRRGDRLAAVVIEPVVLREPDREWLVLLREETDRVGALLVFDEIKTAFRIAVGGAGERYGVTPDLVAIGKALANGFPLAAVGGTAGFMAAAGRSWISSTLATELVALAAAEATLDVVINRQVPEHLHRVGGLLHRELIRLQRTYPDVILTAPGVAEMCFLEYANEQISTAMTSAMAARGVLFKRTAYNFVSLAHGDREIHDAVSAIDESLADLTRK